MWSVVGFVYGCTVLWTVGASVCGSTVLWTLVGLCEALPY